MSQERLTALLKEHKELIGKGVAIRQPYANTSEVMPEDEAKQFDSWMDEADALEENVERERKAMAREDRLSEIVDEMDHPSQEIDSDTQKEDIDKLQAKAFRGYVLGGDRDSMYMSAQNELKALQADLDDEGGYIVAPQLFVQQLLKDVDDLVAIRGLATVFQLGSSESLGAPSLDTDMNDADWTTELATGSEDTATRFGKRELRPHPFAKRVKISNTLLRKAVMDPEAHVRERMAYKFAITEEKGFLTGSGSGQPLGVFTASSQGISTSRDVDTDNTTTAITADGLIEAKHNQKSQYWARLKWIFHRDAIKNIRKLKDGNGQYLWQSPAATGFDKDIGPTIVDSPYIVSEFAPNTFTTGLYVGIIGDFSAYWIADSLAMQVQRVVELYAETNQTGFIGRAEADGMPVLEEAFTRVTLA